MKTMQLMIMAICKKKRKINTIPLYVSLSGHYFYTKKEDREKVFLETLKNIKFKIIKKKHLTNSSFCDIVVSIC